MLPLLLLPLLLLLLKPLPGRSKHNFVGKRSAFLFVGFGGFEVDLFELSSAEGVFVNNTFLLELLDPLLLLFPLLPLLLPPPPPVGPLILPFFKVPKNGSCTSLKLGLLVFLRMEPDRGDRTTLLLNRGFNKAAWFKVKWSRKLRYRV